MLAVSKLSAAYGTQVVLRDINLTVSPGEIVTLIGANGAGKSTLVKCLAGVMPTRGGAITMNGERIDTLWSRERVLRGICLVPEGRQTFGGLTVEANLRLGAYVHAKLSEADIHELMLDCCRPFPILLPRKHEPCANLSGGQQQMLAIARGLMSKPKLLMLDEPSLGLAPSLVSATFRLISELRGRGIAILLSEQNARQSLAISDRAYVIENGCIVAHGTSKDILASGDISGKYLGVGQSIGDPATAKQMAMTKRLREILGDVRAGA